MFRGEPHADSSIAQLMVEGARACGKSLEQRVQASSLDVMCRLVQMRLGITLLPEGVLAPHVTAGHIAMVRLNEDWAVRQMYIVLRDPERSSPITCTLIEHLQRAAGHGTV